MADETEITLQQALTECERFGKTLKAFEKLTQVVRHAALAERTGADLDRLNAKAREELEAAKREKAAALEDAAKAKAEAADWKRQAEEAQVQVRHAHSERDAIKSATEKEAAEIKKNALAYAERMAEQTRSAIADVARRSA